MIAQIIVNDKSFGDKVLYEGLELNIEEGEKLGLIGRNGTGKTTLLGIVTGDDKDFDGEVNFKKGTVVIASRQEHHGHEDKTVLEYIVGDLPEFVRLKHILDTYPAHMGDSDKKMQIYHDALERFNFLGYFEIEDELAQALQAYQVDPSKIEVPLSSLSGGQKRMVELVKVQRARVDLALIDEPTNHMDYIAKDAFIKWFKGAREAVVVITHDRDVLKTVDKIVEIRDGQAFPYKGNYDDYLRINAIKITSEVNEYTVTQRRIANLKVDIVRFRRLKERANDPGTIKRFKSQEQKATTELALLQTAEKPSFWIDRESAGNLNTKMSDAYEEHKARNIKVRTRTAVTGSSRLLIDVNKLSLGYAAPLFADVNFQLHEGDRLRLHGRNGAGKTTLIQAIIAKTAEKEASSKKFAGTIAVEKQIKIGVYEQEIDPMYLNMSLAAAIEHAFMAKDVPISDQKIKQLLGDYLFNSATDGKFPVSQLSGGQKARFQLMNMLAGDPQILILDEPTNHLDLPSIEELEDALKQYHGAIIYISHDSYFSSNIGGETCLIQPPLVITA
ncbi:MAG: ABC-F family ATP-binding cassette domain-containing protein [Candidatus Saccharibacteria bacterium]|nr:ABC-F family ATP-binding cassette domain-containing protein [Candidatus Saccharibacteria bacterium]